MSFPTKLENFLLDIKGPGLAFLPVLAFEGGTRKNIPRPICRNHSSKSQSHKVCSSQQSAYPPQQHRLLAPLAWKQDLLVN
uniref:Uncharacterized protein n=1 Tax=Quercus lobata TaxID=97700 RepID=A0A7N2KUB1_QUELO